LALALIRRESVDDKFDVIVVARDDDCVDAAALLHDDKGDGNEFENNEEVSSLSRS
jgi:hypothetical protein